MSSVSGLSERHRAQARREIIRGCELLLANKGSVHYSQGANRWEGIARGLKIPQGEFPHHGDCSSTATWLLWNALHIPYGVRDVVNGANWRAGYTGTIARHGKLVQHDRSLKVGDLILYGRAPTYEHVVVSLGGRVAFSHGGEAGPFKVDIDYRGDRGPSRRFI